MTGFAFPKPVRAEKKRKGLQRRPPPPGKPRRKQYIARHRPRRLDKPPAADGQRFMAWVRRQRCCVRGMTFAGPCGGAMEANHAGRKPGASMKAPDETTIPCCHDHHQQYTDSTGAFAGWTKAQKMDWRLDRIAETQVAARAAGALRWSGDEPGFVYPPDGCTDSASCPACPHFKCSRCRRPMPWCMGCGDEHDEWCTECWVERHSEGERGCGICGWPNYGEERKAA